MARQEVEVTVAIRPVLLVQPGDVLIIGNVDTGSVDPEAMEAAARFFGEVGIQVALFSEDVQVGALSADQIERLAERLKR